MQPNGIALMKDGSFLLANLGEEGGVWRLWRNGDLEPVLTEIKGKKMPPSNFVMVDRLGRFWITVSTTRTPRALGYRKDVADGFIVVLDEQGPRIVAEGLGYTNEALFDAGMEWLYVNETFARRLSRFRVRDDGTLFDRETFFEFGAGTFPDGLGFDESGGVWVVSIVSNRVLRLSPTGKCDVIVEDANTLHLEEVELAYQNGTMGRPHLDNISSQKLRNITSIAFGGEGRRTAWLGCLLGSGLARFESPWAGIRPVHWHWNF